MQEKIISKNDSYEMYRLYKPSSSMRENSNKSEFS